MKVVAVLAANLAAVLAAVLAAILAVEVAHQDPAHGIIMGAVGMLTVPILQDTVYFGSLPLEVF